jgi:hypothetical protein
MKVLSIVFGVAHVIMQINTSILERVVVRKPQKVSMASKWGFGCIMSSPETSLSMFMPCDLLGGISLVCASIKTLDHSVGKLSLMDEIRKD